MRRLASACLLLAFAFHEGMALAAPPSETLLPETTKGWISSSNVPQMSERWSGTQLGKLLEDPAMDPFMQEVRREVREELRRTGMDFGLTWEDVEDLATGEAAAALIHAPKTWPVSVLLVDVTGNLPRTQEVLNKVFKDLNARRATWQQPEIMGTKVTAFALPRDPKQIGPQRQAVYFVKDNMLCAIDSFDAAKDILGRFGGQAKSSLSKTAGFQKVMGRCQADVDQTDQAAPHIRWYLNPWEFAEARRMLDPEFLKNEKLDLLKAFKASGFTALAAIGGYTHLQQGPYDLVHRVAGFAPPPFEKSMQMLAFPNGGPLLPHDWIPADMAACLTFNWDLKKATANFGPLFDHTVGGGDEGTWADTLDSIKNDKKGPQIDLEKELFAFLGSRVALIADCVLPVTPTSERSMFIASLDNEAKVKQALERYYDKDPTARKRTLDGVDYWEILPEEEEEVADIPDLKIETTGPGGVVNVAVAQAQKQPLEPSAVCVTKGHLLIASHVTLLKKILQPAAGMKPLAQALDFQLVKGHLDDEVKRRSWPKHSMERFTRSDEAFRGPYELTRINKLPESQSLLAQLLSSFLGEGEEGQPRKQRVDGRKLPDFSVARTYLTPVGSIGVTEEGQDFHGWFMVDFTLGKAGTMAASRPGDGSPSR